MHAVDRALVKIGAKACFTVGAPGGTRIVTGILHAILNVIDHHMTATEAIAAPRFDCQGDVIIAQARIAPSVCEQVKAMGHEPKGDVFIACLNNPVLEGDPAECGGAGNSPRLGDIRYSFMAYVPKYMTYGLLGLGPSNNDPETGEIIGRQTRTNIKSAHVVPNPYKENAAWDEETWPGNATGRKVYFVNLPERATITIYSLGGDYIQTLEHDYHLSPSSDFTYWNLVTHNNQEVVSGVYLYHIASEVGEKTGRFAVIR